jgi:hypothetical protein
VVRELEDFLKQLRKPQDDGNETTS